MTEVQTEKNMRFLTLTKCLDSLTAAERRIIIRIIQLEQLRYNFGIGGEKNLILIIFAEKNTFE